MPDPAEKRMRLSRWLVLLVLPFIASLALSALLLQYQVVSSDETTQLAGLSVSPQETLRWLAGENPLRFGVPADRMPPLSYLLQSMWGAMFGFSPYTLRILSIVVSLTALTAFGAMLWRVSPNILGILVFCLLALSLNYLIYTVEIRPYPFFLALASCGAYALLRYSQEPSAKWLSIITVIGIFASYVHFYGVVFAFTMQVAVFFMAFIERRPLRPIIVSIAITAVAWLGLYPFLVSAVAIKSSLPFANLSDFPKLIYRLVATRAHSIYFPVQVLVILGAGVALATAAVSHIVAVRHQASLDWRSRFYFSCLMMITLGLATSLAGAILTKGFNTLEPHYHIWMLPFLFAMMVAMPNQIPAIMRHLNAVGLVFAAIATLAAAGILVRNREAFLHGPVGELQATIEKFPAGTPVIYANTLGEPWIFGYFPLRFISQNKVPQFLVDVSNPAMPFQVPDGGFLYNGGRLAEATEQQVLGRADKIILVQVENFFVADAVNYIRYGKPNIPESMRDKAFAEKFGYRVVGQKFVPGYSSARITVLSKK